MVEVRVDGEKVISNLLTTFPQKLTNRVLKKALRDAAKVIQDEAKRNAPVKTGNLRDSIRIVKRKKVDGKKLSKNELVYSVVPKRTTKRKRFVLADGTKWTIKGVVSDGWYAHMVEFGTSHSAPKSFLRGAVSKEPESYGVFKEAASKGVSKILSEYAQAKGRS